MRSLLVLTLVLLPLVTSSPISLGEEFPLPTLENIETHITNLWGNFKKGYDLVYNTSVEELHRFQIFAKHVKMIVKHNLEHDLGLHSYRLGINIFAALVSSIESKSRDYRHPYPSSRPIKNFVLNWTAINATNITVRSTLISVKRKFLLHRLSRCPSPSIGVIKALSHQWKIKVNAVRVGHSAR